MEDIWSREINELYPIDKQLTQGTKFNMIKILYHLSGLRVQSDMRYRRLDPKLVGQIQNLKLNRRGTRGGKSSKHATGQLILLI